VSIESEKFSSEPGCLVENNLKDWWRPETAPLRLLPFGPDRVYGCIRPPPALADYGIRVNAVQGENCHKNFIGKMIKKG